MKKVLTTALSVLILFSGLSITAFASDSAVKTEKINGVSFEYRVIGGKAVEIVSGSDFVPDKIEGLPVTIIGDSSYRYLKNYAEDQEPYTAKDWKIPETVTYIGSKAFYERLDIKSVEIPSSVTYIGSCAFERCVNLSEISLPDSINIVSDGVFSECRSLCRVELNNRITKIGSNAFFACSALKDISFPHTLKTVGDRAFLHCKSLKSIDFSSLDYSPVLGRESCGYYLKNYISAEQNGPYNGEIKRVKDFKIISSFISNEYDYAEQNGCDFYYNVSTADSSEINMLPGKALRLLFDNEAPKNLKATGKGVSLTQSGLLTTLGKGRAEVTATLKNGENQKIKFNVLYSPVLNKKLKLPDYDAYCNNETQITVKKSKTASLRVYGKAPSIKNKYTSTKYAKIVSKKNTDIIKIKGVKKGTSTVKIKVNGNKTLKLKVKVV